MLFLAIEGIAGSSTDTWHPGEMELAAFSMDAAEPAAAGVDRPGSGGRWQLSVSKMADATTPALMQACHARRVFPTARLTQRLGDDTPTDVLRITMDRVRVADVVLGSGGSGDEKSLVTVVLHFDELSLECRDQHPDGSPASSGACGPLGREPVQAEGGGTR